MWQSFSGYVMIRLDGLGLERFINRMLSADIPVWNVRRISAAAMTAEIRASDFFLLRALNKTARCRVHIVKRRGMPFMLARLRRRKVLLIGAAICFACMVYAQTRICFVHIDGLEHVPLNVVERALEDVGVWVGMPRSGINTFELGSAIRGYDERIAWAGVSLDGVRMHVQVVEAEPIPERPDQSTPVDVIAAKDGIIEKVTALIGKSNVEAGDAVRAGDVLIRGDITREGAQEQLLVHAEGDVMAQVWYMASAYQPKIQPQLAPSGNTCLYRAVYVADFPVYVSDIPFEEYELHIASEQVVNGLIIPVRQVEGVCHELILRQTEVSAEDRLDEAMYQAEMDALEQVPKDARIVEKQSESGILEDGTAYAKVNICTREQIGVPRPL